MAPSSPRLSSGAGILVLGVVFHAIYVLSIFDIYFTSPIVHHIESVAYAEARTSGAAGSVAPADRVVIFVADGCRADKFFEVNVSNAVTAAASTTTRRVAFLRDIIETKGSYGVSHTRVPTESRPGHVALFAGMYEDVSAVTKGWQDNPVDFDSIFNQSRHAWLFGSPDIVPMFARRVPQAHEAHYSHEEEDFAKQASELDVWVWDKFQALLTRAETNRTLDAQLRAPQVIFFCHFLGIDTNGHAHRPNSDDYLNNIALVDELVEKVYRRVEDFYDYDGKTTYVFTADHGMSNKGAHGDGDPANTRTPLVVWGAGVEGPTQKKKATTADGKKGFQIDLPTQSKAQVEAQLVAQEQQEAAALTEWELAKLVRKDVMQADVAPLISSLLGLPYPRNSVGVLPFTYLARGAYRAKAVVSNARQLYLHALRKEQEKETRTLFFFQPYKPFRIKLKPMLSELSQLWQAGQFDAAEQLSQEVIEICLATLEYFQRYDWFFLLGIIVLGYLGWMLVITIVFLYPGRFSVRSLVPSGHDVKFWFVSVVVFAYLVLEASPITYFLYVGFPLAFWNFSWNQSALLLPDGATQQVDAATRERNNRSKWLEVVVIVCCLELVVLGYERRFIFGLVFTLLAAWPFLEAMVANDDSEASLSTVRTLWALSCVAISFFPYFPTEYGEHTLLVLLGGAVLIGMLWLVQSNNGDAKNLAVPAAPVLLSLVTLQWTMSHLQQKTKPPVLLTVLNWLLSLVPIVVLLVKAVNAKAAIQSHDDCGNRMIFRLTEVMLAFAPSYVLLSISYEVFFYVALCAVLHTWVRMEKAQSTASGSSSLWHEVRLAFVFLLLIKIAFFGTGNVASMSSFEISSTYRFVTVFSPFLMGTLLVIKILIPFMVVTCTFHVLLALDRGTNHPPSRYFLLVVGMSDYLAMHFLFLVKNEGSWKEIGNSISMYGIVNAQIVFIPLLFMLAKYFLRDLVHQADATGKKTA